MAFDHPSSMPLQWQGEEALKPFNSQNEESTSFAAGGILAIDQPAKGACHHHQDVDSTNPGRDHNEERHNCHHQSTEVAIDILQDVGQLHKEHLNQVVQLHEEEL